MGQVSTAFLIGNSLMNITMDVTQTSSLEPKTHSAFLHPPLSESYLITEPWLPKEVLHFPPPSPLMSSPHHFSTTIYPLCAVSSNRTVTLLHPSFSDWSVCIVKSNTQFLWPPHDLTVLHPSLPYRGPQGQGLSVPTVRLEPTTHRHAVVYCSCIL